MKTEIEFLNSVVVVLPNGFESAPESLRLFQEKALGDTL
jgi:hypothetical protein